MQPTLSVAVVGAGLLGHGIAQVLAHAGHAVALTDADAAVLDTARARIARNLDELEVPAGPVLERLRTVSSLASAVAGADVVIESVVEVVDAEAVRRRLSAHLIAITRPSE